MQWNAVVGEQAANDKLTHTPTHPSCLAIVIGPANSDSNYIYLSDYEFYLLG